VNAVVEQIRFTVDPGGLVPQSDIEGEQSSATQPFSTISLVPEKFDAADAWGPKPEDVKWCQDKIAALRNEGIFTPPSLRGSIVVPGNVGGMNWSGSAFDPTRNLLFVNVNSLPAMVKLIPRGAPVKDRGEYAQQAGTPEVAAAVVNLETKVIASRLSAK